MTAIAIHPYDTHRWILAQPDATRNESRSMCARCGISGAIRPDGTNFIRYHQRALNTVCPDR